MINWNVKKYILKVSLSAGRTKPNIEYIFSKLAIKSYVFFSFLLYPLQEKNTISIPSESEDNSADEYLPSSDIEDENMFLEKITKRGKFFQAMWFNRQQFK